MKVDNLEQFPVPVQNALKNDNYDGGIGTDISATSLKDSARIPYLKRNNPDHVREDARNMILPLFGTAIHLIMENNSPKDWITEERYYAVVNSPEGEKVLSGQIDAVVPVDPKKAEKFFGKPVPKPIKQLVSEFGGHPPRILATSRLIGFGFGLSLFFFFDKKE